MQNYTWDARDYEESSAAQLGWARELFGKLGLRGNERVLDVGCGDGKVTAELAARLPAGAVLGIDNSPAMIEQAAARHPRSRYPRCSFLLGDARRLPFARAFDLVFSNAVLHWVTDHRPVLRGIARSLKPGGRILLQMGGKGNAAEIVRLLDAMTRSDRWRRWFDGFTFPYGFFEPEEYTPWLDAAGLTPLRVELIPKDMTQEGQAGLEGWIRTTWLPYTQRVPAARRRSFVEQLAAGYCRAHPPDAEGRVHVAMARLEVEAVLTSV